MIIIIYHIIKFRYLGWNIMIILNYGLERRNYSCTICNTQFFRSNVTVLASAFARTSQHPQQVNYTSDIRPAHTGHTLYRPVTHLSLCCALRRPRLARHGSGGCVLRQPWVWTRLASQLAQLERITH